MSSVDELLKSIISSVDATKVSIANVHQKVSDEVYPELVSTLLARSGQKKPEGMSLLSLKNGSLLAYVNAVVLVLLEHLEQLDNSSKSKITGIKHTATKNSVIQRVAMEKGVKPLEKKLAYQVDKMVRAYTRMENEELEQSHKHKHGKKHTHENIEDDDEEDNESGSESGSSLSDDDDEDDDDDDDALAYKPDTSALSKLAAASSKMRRPGTRDGKESAEKYKPPKISAMAPPTVAKTYDEDSGPRAKSGRKLQSMEEYLRENSDLPQVEHSVGSQIVDHGRGGVKTQHERQKEKEIQEYEEANFTRLPQSKTKKSYKQKRADMMNNFAGENWSMFGNSRDLSEGTSRKRKAGSAWDRAKKRR